MNEKMLAQLAKGATPASCKHMAYSPELGGVASWQRLGRPHIWERVLSKHGYSVYFDRGHGGIALFNGETLVGKGKHDVVNDDVFVLDGNYYGLDQEAAIYLRAK